MANLKSLSSTAGFTPLHFLLDSDGMLDTSGMDQFTRRLWLHLAKTARGGQ
jgi:hypothetical protein